MAKRIADIATGDVTPTKKNAAAVKRGKARAAKLSVAERSAIAKKAAKARWKAKQDGPASETASRARRARGANQLCFHVPPPAV